MARHESAERTDKILKTVQTDLQAGLRATARQHSINATYGEGANTATDYNYAGQDSG